jgi:hypothetical protein
MGIPFRSQSIPNTKAPRHFWQENSTPSAFCARANYGQTVGQGAAIAALRRNRQSAALKPQT